MPVILRLFGYKYLFYSNESDEPPHIHVRKGNAHAKFWLEPVSLAKNEGFKIHQLNKLEKIIIANEANFVKAWKQYFKS